MLYSQGSKLYMLQLLSYIIYIMDWLQHKFQKNQRKILQHIEHMYYQL